MLIDFTKLDAGERFHRAIDDKPLKLSAEAVAKLCKIGTRLHESLDNVSLYELTGGQPSPELDQVHMNPLERQVVALRTAINHVNCVISEQKPAVDWRPREKWGPKMCRWYWIAWSSGIIECKLFNYNYELPLDITHFAICELPEGPK